jgi:hypothetical protein
MSLNLIREFFGSVFLFYYLRAMKDEKIMSGGSSSRAPHCEGYCKTLVRHFNWATRRKRRWRTCTAATASPPPDATAAFLEASPGGQLPAAAVHGWKETNETREGNGEHRGTSDLQLQDAGGQLPVLLPRSIALGFKRSDFSPQLQRLRRIE